MSYRRCPDYPLDSEDDLGQGHVDLDVEALLRMSPSVNGQDLACIAARHLLVSFSKSQESVRETFFPTHKKHKCEDRIEAGWFDFDRLAVLLVCQTVAGLNDEYGIRDMLEQEQLFGQLGEIYNSADWKRLGFALYSLVFETIVRDEITKLPFTAFVKKDRQRWALELEQRVCNPQWVYALLHGDLSQAAIKACINLVLLKLHLLHPPTDTSAFHYLSKEVPDLTLDLVTTNYLGGPLDWHLLGPEVEAVVNAEVYPGPGRPRVTAAEVEVYYGVRVTEFIMEYARPLGLWSGKYAHNRRVLNFRDRCLVM